MSFLRIIRWPNLLIIIILFYLLRQGMYLPFLKDFGISPVLNDLHFGLFVLTTLLITAGGYIVNDIYDVDIDAHNVPKKQIVGKLWGLRKSWMIYLSLSTLGLGISAYLGFYIRQPLWIFIFPSACILLWLYASYWKRQPLIGNIIVSLFSAGVVWIIYLSETQSIQRLPNKESTFITQVTSIYFVFALLTSLFREIIKDLQDKEGDALFGAKTIAILWKTSTVKKICFSILTIIGNLILGVLIHFLVKQEHLYFTYYTSFLLFINIILAYLTYTAEVSSHYKAISRLTKVFMLLGILGLILVNWLFINVHQL